MAPNTEWYVAVDGNESNDGDIQAPWSLEYAGEGAGGRIAAGHTVWLRGGTYNSDKGWTVRKAVSGAPGMPITFRPYIDPATSRQEVVVLDGSLAEFRTGGNAAWVPHGSPSQNHNVYRSIEVYPIGSYFAYLQIGGEWYSLASVRNDIRYITSDNHDWDASNPFYLGPSICQDQAEGSPTRGHLFVRLDNSDPGTQLGRDVAQIGEPNPSQHALYVGSSSIGLKVEGSHLVFEDLEINNFYLCCQCGGGLGERDVTFRRVGGRTHSRGIRANAVDGLTLDSCEWRGHMSAERWWLSYSDVKGGPAQPSLKTAIYLNHASNVEIVNCLADGFFDGILAEQTHHVEVHGCEINGWDDAWQMWASLYRVDYHHNVHFGAGPSRTATGSKQPNVEPGTVFIHHNLIDTTQYVLFWGRKGHREVGFKEPIAFSSHSRPTEYAVPWKLYHNTVVTGRVPRTGRVVGWFLVGALARQCEARHEVMNNIFVARDGRAGGRDFYAHTGREVYDGNVYWHYGATSPSEHKTPWRFLHTGEVTSDSVQTVDDLRKSPFFEASQVYYPPGWEASGLTQDPQLDGQYRPRSRSCHSGAVDIHGKCWPGTEQYEPWRGAFRPGGQTHDPDLDRRIGRSVGVGWNRKAS